MRVFDRKNPFPTAILAGLAVVAFATPSLAGTVYKWTTENGTASFTDDPKRIPARYKQAAEQRPMGKLRNYSRLTVSAPTTEKSHGERIEARLDSLRRAQATPAVSAAPPGLYGTEALNVAIGNGDQLTLPLAGAAGVSAEPLTTEEHRVRFRNTIATQNVRVTRRGDQIVAVTVSPRNQRPITEKVPGLNTR